MLLWLLCSRVFSCGQRSPQRSLQSLLTGVVVRACCASRPRLHPHSSLASRVCGESTCSRDSFCPSLSTLCLINVSLVGVKQIVFLCPFRRSIALDTVHCNQPYADPLTTCLPRGGPHCCLLRLSILRLCACHCAASTSPEPRYHTSHCQDDCGGECVWWPHRET